MHTSPSGKRYVGLTSQRPERRWNKGKGYKQHPYFYSAINKYGWDNFEHKILFDNLTQQEAERLEQICIILFKSHIREFGYNLQMGGQSGNYSGKTPDFSKEDLERRRQRWIDDNPRSQEVYCLETDTFYISCAEAARKLNLSKSQGNHISDCCRGVRKSVGGYHFCYAKDKETKEQQSCLDKDNEAKAVYCLETNEIYPSALIAARQVLKTDCKSGVVRACKGKTTCSKGYHFCYAEEKDTKIWENLNAKKDLTKKFIQCIETGDIYPTAIAAAKAVLNKNDGHTVSRVCRKEQQSTGGFHFKYVNEEGDDI